jgi:hypothetical protein
LTRHGHRVFGARNHHVRILRFAHSKSFSRSARLHVQRGVRSEPSFQDQCEQRADRIGADYPVLDRAGRLCGFDATCGSGASAGNAGSASAMALLLQNGDQLGAENSSVSLSTMHRRITPKLLASPTAFQGNYLAFHCKPPVPLFRLYRFCSAEEGFHILDECADDGGRSIGLRITTRWYPSTVDDPRKKSTAGHPSVDDRHHR